MANIKHKKNKTKKKKTKILSVSFFSYLAKALLVLHGFLTPIPHTEVSLLTELSPQILIHKIFPSSTVTRFIFAV